MWRSSLKKICILNFEIPWLFFFILGKKKKALTSISLLASSTLCKAAFLCSVLAEEIECHHLAFKVGMFGLEMPRPPASSKALEVCRECIRDRCSHHSRVLILELRMTRTRTCLVFRLHYLQRWCEFLNLKPIFVMLSR